MKAYNESVLSHASPKTVNLRLSVLTTFAAEHRVKLDETEWKLYRKRKLNGSASLTADKSGTREEWRKILLETSTQGRALLMFLLSSGCRIGETLELKLSDLDLDADPPRCHIRARYTKGGKSERTVFLTQESKHALLNYLEWRKGRTVRGGRTTYDATDRLFPITASSARETLNVALEKARLDDRDEDTNRYKIHIHSCRKYFRSNCSLDESLTNSIMGHMGYLDKSYLRQDPDRAGKEFKRLSEQNLTFLAVTGMEQVRRQAVIDSLRAANSDITNEKISAALSAAGLNDINEGTPDKFSEFARILGQSQIKPEQKIVSIDELQKYMDKGWAIKMPLNHEKALVERYPTTKA